MYIVYVKDDLGGYIDVGYYDTIEEAENAKDEFQKDDPWHQYMIKSRS